MNQSNANYATLRGYAGIIFASLSLYSHVAPSSFTHTFSCLSFFWPFSLLLLCILPIQSFLIVATVLLLPVTIGYVQCVSSRPSSSPLLSHQTPFFPNHFSYVIRTTPSLFFPGAASDDDTTNPPANCTSTCLRDKNSNKDNNPSTYSTSPSHYISLRSPTIDRLYYYCCLQIFTFLKQFRMN